jgi:hypothetical protein
VDCCGCVPYTWQILLHTWKIDVCELFTALRCLVLSERKSRNELITYGRSAVWPEKSLHIFKFVKWHFLNSIINTASKSRMTELFRRSSSGLLNIFSQHPPAVAEKDNGMLVSDGSKGRKLNCFIGHKAEATISNLKTSRCFNMEQVCEVLKDCRASA